VTDARSAVTTRLNERGAKTDIKVDVMNFTSRIGIKVLVVVMVCLGAGDVAAERHLAASGGIASASEVNGGG